MKTFKDYIEETQNSKVYYRGTNNPSEDTLVKSKKLLPSLNHLTGQREKGISVSDVPDVGEYFKYLYKIKGIEIGEGADGEPLLDPNTIYFVKWVKK
jgi:hypothetical protein